MPLLLLPITWALPQLREATSFIKQHCQMIACSACCIVLTFCIGLCNWSWNMCTMVNWSTLIENNICSCASFSVWTILPTRIRKIHQVVLGLNIGLSQDISYWCSIHICILLQYQGLISMIVSTGIQMKILESGLLTPWKRYSM